MSPILGNLYLNELDEFIGNKYEFLSPRERRTASIPCYIVRYADDAVILCRSKEHAETLKREVEEFLSNNLKLQLSAEKTLVTHADDGFDFLGFNIRRWRRQGTERVLVKPSRKAIQRFKSTIARDSRALQIAPGTAAIALLNKKIRGFAEHFRRGNTKEIFSTLDNYIWWLVFHRLKQRTREPPRTVARRFMYRYNQAANLPHHRKSTARNFGFKDDDGNVHMLDKLGFYKIEYPDKCSQKNPYVLEDREWLDGNRKLRELMKTQQAKFIQKIYGLSKNWASYRKHVVQRQDGRCVKCACKLRARNTHIHHWPRPAGETQFERDRVPDYLVALCIPCYRKIRQQNVYKRKQASPNHVQTTLL